MSLPEFDITKPLSVEQDAALAISVLRRFSADGQPFTPGDALRVVQAIERLAESGIAPQEGGWRCFHCGEAFAERRAAALHFGVAEDQTLACQIKGSEGGLLKALREAEDALYEATAALHAESGETMRAWAAQQSRHHAAVRSAEETGYKRGINDRRRAWEILSRALCWHGDRARMATTREEWQQEIDEAIRWVMDNPEEGRPSFPTARAL